MFEFNVDRQSQRGVGSATLSPEQQALLEQLKQMPLEQLIEDADAMRELRELADQTNNEEVKAPLRAAIRAQFEMASREVHASEARRLDPFPYTLRATSDTAARDDPNDHRLTVKDPSHPVAQQWARRRFAAAQVGHVGTVRKDVYQPRNLLANPPRPEDITLEMLLAAGAHLGHATPLWHPGNAQYIYGVRGAASGDPIHIISLDVTAAHLRRACKVVQGVAERAGVILFVGTRNGQSRTVVQAAALAKGYHLFTKWIPGSITNGQQILGKCAKKVVDEHDAEVPGYAEQLHTTAAVKPDLVVCLNPLENYVLLRECGQNGIPTIGVVDTDCNPTWVTYPIPANDDSLRCIQVIAGALGRAGEHGQALRLQSARRGVVAYETATKLAKPSQAALAAAQGGAAGEEFDALSPVSKEQSQRDQALLAAVDKAFEELRLAEEEAEASSDATAAPAVKASSPAPSQKQAPTPAAPAQKKPVAAAAAADAGPVIAAAPDVAVESQRVAEPDPDDLDIRPEDYAQLLRAPSTVPAAGDHLQNVEIADPAAEPDPSSYESAAADDEGDTDVAAPDPEADELGQTTRYEAKAPAFDPASRKDTVAHPFRPSSTAFAVDANDADDDAARLERALAQFPGEAEGRDRHLHADDADSPIGVEFRVDNTPKPRATDPSAEVEEGEESEEGSSTWEQVGEVERELGEDGREVEEEEEEEEDLPSYRRGEAVREEKPVEEEGKKKGER